MQALRAVGALPPLPKLTGFSYHDADAAVKHSAWQKVMEKVGWGDYDLDRDPPQLVHCLGARMLTAGSKINHFVLAPAGGPRALWDRVLVRV